MSSAGCVDAQQSISILVDDPYLLIIDMEKEIIQHAFSETWIRPNLCNALSYLHVSSGNPGNSPRR